MTRLKGLSICIIFILFAGAQHGSAQGFWKKLKGDSGFSIVNRKDFFQSESFPKVNPQNTRYKITQNIAVDIKGKYPIGYEPRWQFFSYNGYLDFEVDNFIVKRPLSNAERKTISIGNYSGKTVVRFSAFIGADCVCDVEIKDTLNIISNTPQTFKLSNFRKIVNNNLTMDKCIGRSNYTQGGWKGKITLSSNENADINMDIVLENFQNKVSKATGSVSYRYNATGITVKNEMSAQNAIKLVEKERIEKEKRKNYVSKITKQADSIKVIIKEKFSQENVSKCFYSSSGTYIDTKYIDQYYVRSGAYAGTKTEWDLNVRSTIENRCDHDLEFIGIQQLFDKQKGYYLKLVTKVMPKGYGYQIDQSAMSNAFMSILGLQKGSEFNFKLQDDFYPKYARVGLIQWLKVVRRNG